MKTRAILFDCDGTIIDSEDQTIESICFAIEKVHAHLPSKKLVKNHFGPGADKILQELIGDEKKATEAFIHFIEHQKQVIPGMKVYDGIRVMLKELKNAGIVTGMVTGRHSRDLELVLKAHQLENYFDVIVADDLLNNPKPHPEGLQHACALIKIPPRLCYYAGDAKTDMEAAKAAGVAGIAALWDHRVDREVMRLESPAIMADTPYTIIEKFIL